MPLYNITPSIGTALTQTGKDAAVQPGSKVVGLDGHDYIHCRNATGAQINAATAVTLADPAMTITAGAGGYTTVVAVPAGEFGWVRRTAL